MTEENIDARCGFVAIVGRPNVGKSTLINYIVGQKVAIVSDIPQTTRFKIKGIFNDKRGQIIFLDTPGLHIGKDRLDKYMNVIAKHTINEVDLIIHLVDSSEPVKEEETMVVRFLEPIDKPIILGLNKIDLGGKFIPEYIKLYEKTKKKSTEELADSITLLPLSSLKGTNVDKLLDEIFTKLPVGQALYPKDTIRDESQNLFIADVIREKLLGSMRQEIPHVIAVLVEEIIWRSHNLVYIKADILIERDPQRKIVVGKNGQVLKNIGTQARKELEEYLSKKVYLDLVVKTKEKWRQDPRILKELGYSP